MKNATRAAIATAAAAATLAVPTAAVAAGPVPTHRQTITVDCARLGTVTIVAPPEAAGDNWSAAQIVGDGHLVPVAFRYHVYDQTAGLVLGDDTVTHPAGHRQQPTTTCTQSQFAVLGDLVAPDAPLPDGASLSDSVVMSLTVTAIVKP